MFFNKNTYYDHKSINPQNEQGKYILDMMKRNIKIKDPLFQNSVEKKFKEKNRINLSEISKFSQQNYNETQLLERICIYI